MSITRSLSVTVTGDTIFTTTGKVPEKRRRLTLTDEGGAMLVLDASIDEANAIVAAGKATVSLSLFVEDPPKPAEPEPDPELEPSRAE